MGSKRESAIPGVGVPMPPLLAPLARAGNQRPKAWFKIGHFWVTQTSEILPS